ncbi:MAG: hypothetical protein R3E13_04440 [Alphaproteobacteria bacterium]
MGRIIYYLAMVANFLALAAAVFLLLTQARSMEDSLVVFVVMLAPLLAVIAIYERPDWEERKLERRVRKARLRKELEELGGA